MGSSSEPLFSWLHLSDIHFGHGSATEREHRKLVLNRLLRDLHNAENWGAPPPDAVFVTGDIGFSGDALDRQEYMQASSWLRGLARQLNLMPHDIYPVPGNHDVPRTRGEDSRTLELLQQLRAEERQLDDALDEADARDLLIGRMKHYQGLAAQFGPRPDSGALQETLSWSHSLEVRGRLKLRLGGLNTALLANDDQDSGHLRLGLHQLSRAFFQDVDTDELFIALAHHPPSWLGDRHKIEPWLESQVHIFLCGHIHEQKSVSIQRSGGRRVVRVASGALHEVPAPGEIPVRFAFNFGAVYPGPHGKLQLRVWPFIWTKHCEFRPDSEHLREPKEYYASHDLEIPTPCDVTHSREPRNHTMREGQENGSIARTVNPRVQSMPEEVFQGQQRIDRTQERESPNNLAFRQGLRPRISVKTISNEP